MLHGVASSDPETVGNKLLEIAGNMYTETTVIGLLHGFELAAATISREDEMIDNRFYVIGKSGYRYCHNSGILSGKAETVAYSFIRALEKLPNMMAEKQKEIEAMETDVPVLQRILEEKWDKTLKLQHLNMELDTLERKIKTTLALINDIQEDEDETPEEGRGEAA